MQYWNKDIWILPIHRKKPLHWVLCIIRVFHGSTTCAPTLIPTLIPILQSWKPEVGPLFSSWDPNRRRIHDLDPTLCPNFSLQITCQILTVELANFAPNFVQVGKQVGVECGIKVGTKLAYCETPYCCELSRTPSFR